MTFRPEAEKSFLETFFRFEDAIRSQPGCTHLELLKAKDECVYFTYSHWNREEDLEAYRHSETFKTVWPLTKKHFAARPEAHTVTREDQGAE